MSPVSAIRRDHSPYAKASKFRYPNASARRTLRTRNTPATAAQRMTARRRVVACSAAVGIDDEAYSRRRAAGIRQRVFAVVAYREHRACPVGAAPEQTEPPARRSVHADATDARQPPGRLGALDRAQ